MYIKFKSSFFVIIILFLFSFLATAKSAENLKKVGKFKDWETYVMTENNEKVCFAQSIPVLKSPKKYARNPSRLFISFRPSENIKNEISVTAGYIFKKKTPVVAKSGKKTFDFFTQEDFAWMSDNEEEEKFISAMKKASRVMITGKSDKGQKTIDHYSLMGFTKAYNSAKKNCS